MNYFQAHKILDEVKDGRKYTLETINKALELTGDRLEPHEELRSSRMDAQIQRQGKCLGTLRCTTVVA
jgi:hypothetical protein